MIRVRIMVTDDLEQVHAIDRLSFSLPWSIRSFRFELLENSASKLWVAEETRPDGSQGVVGVIVIWMLVDEAHIATIAVHPEYRRRGIGQKLLAYAVRAASDNDMEFVTLEVRESNAVAQALYRKFGFEVVGRRPRYYQDTLEDAVLMSASLTGGNGALLRRLVEVEFGGKGS